MTERPSWHREAACRGRVDVMFLERGDDPAEARRLCAGCPVREPCAEAGIDEPPGTGVGSLHVTGGRHDAAQLDTSLYPAEGCFFVSGNRHGRVMERVLREALREDQDELTLAEARELAEEEACNHFGMTVDEFRRAAKEGTLPEDNPMVAHLALLTGAEIHSC